MTELTTNTGSTIEEMAAALGAANTKSGSTKIPSLKINSKGEDDNGNQIPLGAFFLNTPSGRVYAKEGVRLRAFSNHIQYQHWGTEGNLINKSILMRNNAEEAIDQLGGVMCGMPTYEESRQMSEEERKQFNGRDRFRIIRAVVSYTGKTAEGEEVTITNEPCKLELKRKNYGPFFHDVTSKMGERNLWDFECLLRGEKLKNPAGMPYYKIRFDPQFHKPLEMDQDTSDSIQAVAQMVQSENARIVEMYKAAGVDEEVSQAINSVDNSLEKDLVG